MCEQYTKIASSEDHCFRECSRQLANRAFPLRMQHLMMWQRGHRELVSLSLCQSKPGNGSCIYSVGKLFAQLSLFWNSEVFAPSHQLYSGAWNEERFNLNVVVFHWFLLFLHRFIVWFVLTFFWKGFLKKHTLCWRIFNCFFLNKMKKICMKTKLQMMKNNLN